MNENSSSFLLTKYRNYSIIIVERVREMNDCIYFDKEWSRCLEKHHQCRIKQEQCKNCQYKETYNFGEDFRKKRKEPKV